ncbi:hypothetical protein [Agromyces salentinus]|uniref:Uncharacterized protein n=1 Tax=Agromyces salentinus TaxID=269421 RepID=A0ABP4YT55_9MICO|nr:hypothetical protein [Agromyces salentinus]
MTDRTKSRSRATRWSAGYGLVAVGIILMLVGIGPVEGFVGGMLAGAGFALTLLGAVGLAATAGWLGSRTASGEGWWLPSRDGDR